MAGGSLVGVVAVASLLVVSASGGSTDPSTAAATPPALPCPSSGHSLDTKAMTAPASTSHGVTWAGVFERIFVKTSMTGAVSKTPKQHTLVAAAGQGTATVNVPVSSSHVHHDLFHKRAKVVNGVAHVNLNLKRSTSERLVSDYNHPLPVSVKVTYKLDGNPISASDIKGKSGNVEVDYQVTNTTAKPVHVCFEGFNGKQVKQTVTEVAPIYAYLSLTLPKHVSAFTAPGGFVNADRSGVNPQWVIALFKPLGPTQQTVKFTMDTSKAKIPKATLLLEFVQPEALTGSTPARSALVVARAQAGASAAARKVQADVAALELKAAQPRQPRSSSGRGGSQGGKSSRASRSGKSSRAGAPSLSFGTSTASLARMQSQVGSLGQADRTFFNGVSGPTGKLIGSTSRSIDALTASTGRSVNDLAGSTTRSIDDLTASTSRSIDHERKRTARSLLRLASELRRAVDTPSLDSITARAGQLQSLALAVGTLAGGLVPEVSGLAGQIQNLVSALPTPVADALRLYLLFGQLNQDLDAFAPAVKTTAEFLKLQADVTAGQALAQTVSNSLTQIQTQAQAVAGQVQTLQSNVLSLQTKIGALVTAAVTNAENTTQALVDNAVSGVEARFTADIVTARESTTDAEHTARQQLAAAQHSANAKVDAATTSAHQAVSSASNQTKRAIDASLRSARQSVTAAELKVNQTLASVHAKAQAALAAAKAKAKQGGQAALAAAQASAAQAEAAARNALTTANNDYADLLGTNQQAVAWELPGGDATNVTEQEGSLIYTISGS